MAISTFAARLMAGLSALFFLAGFALLIPADIATPNRTNHFSLFTIAASPFGEDLPYANLDFGIYGWCSTQRNFYNNPALGSLYADHCETASGPTAYSVGDAIGLVFNDDIRVPQYLDGPQDRTRAFVLPIASTALAGIAFLCAAVSTVMPPANRATVWASIGAVVFSVLAWVLAFSGFGCILALFNNLRSSLPVNFIDPQLDLPLRTHFTYYPIAYVGKATWSILAAVVVLFFGTMLMFVALFLQSRASRRSARAAKTPGNGEYPLQDRPAGGSAGEPAKPPSSQRFMSGLRRIYYQQ